ncbi:hypothetical protein J0K78_06325 [Halobacillus sp. GSS1]|uniref:hypothetical protein n=1 Tax=Halobacillus sp. GSS1 TaxID=2815919 RepID=UPI001A8E82D8|nr:hypothetical protein [Halobacillus sp. GSS1]MBN9653876.1 hypothetical protein [Halobacillus sp. GSS1]
MTTRRFKAVVDRQAESTGVGIVEYVEGGETIAIHSLYYDKRLSNRDTYLSALKRVEQLTKTDDTAILRTAVMQNKPQWRKDHPNIYGKVERFKPQAFGEPLDLARDAILRGSTIHEQLNEMER